MGRLRDNLRESTTAFTQVLRNPGLRRLNLAWAGSIIGDWAFAIVVSIYAFEQGGATAVGLLGVVRYVLMAVVGPLVALVADRFERRHVMLTADGLRIVTASAAAVCIAAGAPAIFVYGLTVLTVVSGTAFRPAQAALLPALATAPAELTAANVVSSTIESVGFFAGPAIAALLLAFTTAAVVVAFDAVTFAWSFSLLLGLRVRDTRAELGGEREPMVRDLLAGREARPPTLTEQRSVLHQHFTLSVGLHGEKAAGKMMRKFGIKFAAHHPRADEVKAAMIAVNRTSDWVSVLEQFYPASASEPALA